jgi:anti-sigma B factor antagonist
MDLGLEVHERDGWTVLSVSGEIDMATAPSLRERLHALLDDVGFLDSTALGVLVGVLKRARSEGGEVRIASTQPRVRKVFEITRLDSAFDLFDDVDGAVRGAQE